MLGERGLGHVHVVDERSQLGGHLTWLRLVPGMGGFGRVADYRIGQLQRLDNVVTVGNRRLDVDAVLGYGADVVVIATGARWIGLGDDALEPPLAELAGTTVTVVTPEEVMAGRAVGGPVLVWDAEGSGVASGVAEHLATRGLEVTIATPFDVVSPSLDASFAGAKARENLRVAGVVVRCAVRPVRGSADGLVLVDGSGTEIVTEAVTIVVASQRGSDDRLFRALRSDPERVLASGITTVLRVGDCVAPRLLGFAVADGHRVGRELDSSAPSVPLPRPERDHDALRGAVRLNKTP